MRMAVDPEALSSERVVSNDHREVVDIAPASPAAPPARRAQSSIGSIIRSAPVLAGLITLAVATFAIAPWPVGVFYDDGIYLILGKALATGEGLRYLNLPGHPAATHYPPGYPVLLALLWKLAPDFPRNVILFKLANAVLLALACAGLTQLAMRRLRLPPIAAAAAVLAFGIAIPVLSMSGVLFSEPLFLALLAPALLMTERAVEEPDNSSGLILAGVLCGALTLVRTIGIAAVAAALIVLVLRRRSAASFSFFAAAATILLPWQLWVTAHTSEVPAILQGSYGSYLGWFLDAFRERGAGFAAAVAMHNAGEVARPVGTMFSPHPVAAVRVLMVLTVTLTFGVGLVRTARRAPVCAGFLVGYLAIVLLWPYVPDRFLWGVWPVLGLVTAAGIHAIIDARRPEMGLRVARFAALALVSIAALSYARYNLRGYAGRWWESAQRSSADSSRPLVRWANNNTRPTDVIATDGDPLVHLYTGRLTVPAISWKASEYLDRQQDIQATSNMRSIIDQFGVRYVMLGSRNSPAANAAQFLTSSTPPALTLTRILPEGGAIFTTTTP